MKKIIKYKAVISFLMLTTLLVGCSPSTSVPTPQEDAAQTPSAGITPVSENQEPVSVPLLQDYQETGGEVALITDHSSIEDHGFNESAYEGTKTYAQAAGISYSYYSASDNSQTACEKVIEAAISDGSRLLICAGSDFRTAVGRLQGLYPEIDFLLLDGVPLDSTSHEISMTSNVHCITYKEEEAGYLAGYMAVLEGYTQLGFIGGEAVPPVIRYGYGYLQGINDAAVFLGNEDTIDVSYWYSNTFNSNTKITETAEQWYQSGTEIIFSCGGSIFDSILTAADTCDGKLIGADINQSYLSERVITSAMKEITNSVIMALDEYRANGDCWNAEAAGQTACYGASEKCIALPTDDTSWRFDHVTTDTYASLYSQLKKGEIIVNSSTLTSPSVSVNVTYMTP